MIKPLTIKVPVVKKKDDVLSEGAEVSLELYEDYLELTYDYQVTRNSENELTGKPELFTEKIDSEFTIKKKSIQSISCMRDDDNEVYSVDIVSGAIIISSTGVDFKSANKAKEFKKQLTKWWLGESRI